MALPLCALVPERLPSEEAKRCTIHPLHRHKGRKQGVSALQTWVTGQLLLQLSTLVRVRQVFHSSGSNELAVMCRIGLVAKGGDCEAWSSDCSNCYVSKMYGVQVHSLLGPNTFNTWGLILHHTVNVQPNLYT